MAISIHQATVGSACILLENWPHIDCPGRDEAADMSERHRLVRKLLMDAGVAGVADRMHVLELLTVRMALR